MAAERLRVLGEDSPSWLIGAFGLIGALVATAAVWLWFNPPTAVGGQAVADANVKVAAPPPPPECPPPVLVPFEFGFSRLDTAIITPLATPVVARVTRDPAARLIVLGHADATGQEKQNFLLSYRRAQAVASWLAEAGVPRDRVRVRAAGSQEPIAGLSPEADSNRRAAILFTGLPGCPDN